MPRGGLKRYSHYMLITQLLIASSWEKVMSSVISPHSPDLDLLSPDLTGSTVAKGQARRRASPEYITADLRERHGWHVTTKSTVLLSQCHLICAQNFPLDFVEDL